jgi:hypothetical protein
VDLGGGLGEDEGAGLAGCTEEGGAHASAASSAVVVDEAPFERAPGADRLRPMLVEALASLLRAAPARACAFFERANAGAGAGGGAVAAASSAVGRGAALLVAPYAHLPGAEQRARAERLRARLEALRGAVADDAAGRAPAAQAQAQSLQATTQAQQAHVQLQEEAQWLALAVRRALCQCVGE